MVYSNKNLFLPWNDSHNEAEIATAVIGNLSGTNDLTLEEIMGKTPLRYKQSITTHVKSFLINDKSISTMINQESHLNDYNYIQKHNQLQQTNCNKNLFQSQHTLWQKHPKSTPWLNAWINFTIHFTLLGSHFIRVWPKNNPILLRI